MYVTRIALFVCLSALPLLGADDTLARYLKGIQDHYNHARTLQVAFNETYVVQGRPRQSESGTLTLRKPGRMRWEYSTPAGKLFVSDGKDVYLYTPDANRVEKTRLKDSEDVHAPLAFLLGKLDLQKEFRDFQLKSEGSQVFITAKSKTERLPYDEVRITATPQFAITNLVITGQDQSVLTFNFSGEKVNPPVNDNDFKFDMPPGAKLVTPEAGQ
jgi:outer membrane lipoprotein carrier protein